MRTAVDAVTIGAGVTRLELLDALNIRAINLYSGTAFPETPCLFVEASGTEESVAGDLALVLALADGEGATEIVHERDAEARRRLWAARHNAAYSWSQIWPGTKHCSTDVCVPVSELAAAIAVSRAEVDRLGLRAGIIGHVGDGNFHVGVTVDPDDADEIARLHELTGILADDAMARGGTCTGEHGIGLGKIDSARAGAPRPAAALPRRRGAVRRRGIINPGKVLASAESLPAG